MAKQSILWTALPFGRVSEGPHAGSLRLSIVVSPRLTPQNAAEQKLGAAGFADFHNWPETLDKVKLGLRIGNQTVPVKRISQTDPRLWEQIFGSDTPVAGFTFRDMSRVNLRSFPVRHVLGFVRDTAPVALWQGGSFGFLPMPGTSVQFETGRDALPYLDEIAHFTPEPLCPTDDGFLSFRLHL